jgi:oxygen-independent coproporphyrinogen-3 oxidase
MGVADASRDGEQRRTLHKLTPAVATAIDPLTPDIEKVFRRKPLGVYVHFPWCLQKCPYCDFLSIPAERAVIPHAAYADAVLAEFVRRRRTSASHDLRSVFFGGGTPSLWEPRQLGRVLRSIVDSFGVSPSSVEVTVECNPSSFDDEVARALLDVGVNRISIGVQGLNAERLRFLGRLHDPAGGLAAVQAAVRAGVPRVSADLIFGVAGQDPETAATEASTVADTGLSHVSAYALTIEPNTRFGSLARKGRLPLLRETTVAESFEAVHVALTAKGFDHYEVSNYARNGDTARHNLGYWRGDDYLGIGLGAWGTVTDGDRRVRYRNTAVAERYISGKDDWATIDLDASGTGGLVSEVEAIDAETALAERLMLGLRLAEGVDVDGAAREVGAEPWPTPRRRAVERMIERKRIVREGSRLRIPVDAWLHADGTIAEVM